MDAVDSRHLRVGLYLDNISGLGISTWKHPGAGI